MMKQIKLIAKTQDYHIPVIIQTKKRPTTVQETFVIERVTLHSWT